MMIPYCPNGEVFVVPELQLYSNKKWNSNLATFIFSNVITNFQRNLSVSFFGLHAFNAAFEGLNKFKEVLKS